MIKIILISILPFFMVGCIPRGEPKKINAIPWEKKRDIGLQTENFKDFSVSECQTDCTEPDGVVLKNSFNNGDLKVKLGDIRNCIWSEAFFESYEITGDTLRIRIEYPYYVGRDDDNNEVLIQDEMDCDCYFFFKLELENIESKPKHITLNGYSFSFK
jgi:hypothetical protein